jgi:hypothetical protein
MKLSGFIFVFVLVVLTIFFGLAVSNFWVEIYEPSDAGCAAQKELGDYIVTFFGFVALILIMFLPVLVRDFYRYF